MKTKQFAIISTFYLFFSVLMAHFVQNQSFWTVGFFLGVVIQFFMLWGVYVCLDRTMNLFMHKVIEDRWDKKEQRRERAPGSSFPVFKVDVPMPKSSKDKYDDKYYDKYKDEA